MEKLKPEMDRMRQEHHGKAQWIGKEQVLVKKTVGATRGRPRLNGQDEDNEEDEEDEEDEEEGEGGA